jgi:hypothetical protein
MITDVERDEVTLYAPVSDVVGRTHLDRPTNSRVKPSCNQLEIGPVHTL